MPLRAFYIGEPVSARGWLLAGVRTACPEPTAEAVWSALEVVYDKADLVLLDSTLAQLVTARLARLMERKPLPPLLHVGAMEDGDLPLCEILESARRELGAA